MMFSGFGGDTEALQRALGGYQQGKMGMMQQAVPNFGGLKQQTPTPANPGAQLPQPRQWGQSVPGFLYPQVEGPGNPSWEARNPQGQPSWHSKLGGNTGVAGNIGEIARIRQQPASQMPMQTPAAQMGLGAFGNKLEGFDWNKMNSGHNSPKYQFGRVFSNFDPQGGITQAMLDQLNQLGLGTVSGKIGGDKIQLSGNIDPRFEGITQFDIKRDLEGDGGWQWGAITGNVGGGSRVPRQGGSAIMQALGGGHPAYAPGFAGNAPYAASSWLSDLLRSLGVSL